MLQEQGKCKHDIQLQELKYAATRDEWTTLAEWTINGVQITISFEHMINEPLVCLLHQLTYITGRQMALYLLQTKE